MDEETRTTQLFQLPLIDLGDTKSGTIELFPVVWGALESLTSPDISLRHSGLDTLIQLDAARLSPLVAYTLATRLDDQDIELRARIVGVLAGVLVPDVNGWIAPESLRLHLKQWLAAMRTRQVFALLQVFCHDSSLGAGVATLLNACSYAGNHLADILSNRKLPLSVRKSAVAMIQRVGYIDAIPVLERLELRLESKLNGQQIMSFVVVDGSEETELLPAIHQALISLRAP
jgi:HEAT repeat protein